MPSAKPSAAEIKALRKKRELWHPGQEEDQLAQVRGVCGRLCGNGYITPAAATELLDWCVRFSAVADTYPTSTLVKALTTILAADSWTTERERDLIRFITAYYIADPDHASQSLGDIFQQRNDLLGDLYDDIFDEPGNTLDLSNRFVAHTGKFGCGSRAACFDLVRSLGGTPADIAWYCDYLFVADDHVESRTVSSKIDAAIGLRARWGSISILRESVWQRLIEGSRG